MQGSCPNIASTALVGASRSLHMAGSTQALAASVQTMAIAATVISTGLLADRLGRRKVLMVALLVGAIGNLVVLAAPSPVFYMLGMAITGIGLGAVYGAAFGYMAAVVPKERMAAPWACSPPSSWPAPWCSRSSAAAWPAPTGGWRSC